MPILRSADYEHLILNGRNAARLAQDAPPPEDGRRLQRERESAYEEAREAAREEAMAEVARILEDLRASVEEFMRGSAAIVADAIELAFGELTSPDMGLRALDRAIARLGLRTDVVVHASPSDVPHLVARLATDPAQAPRHQIIEDPLLADGELVIVSLFGRVHVGARAQARAFGEAFDGED